MSVSLKYKIVPLDLPRAGSKRDPLCIFQKVNLGAGALWVCWPSGEVAKTHILCSHRKVNVNHSTMGG